MLPSASSSELRLAYTVLGSRSYGLRFGTRTTDLPRTLPSASYCLVVRTFVHWRMYSALRTRNSSTVSSTLRVGICDLPLADAYATVFPYQFVEGGAVLIYAEAVFGGVTRTAVVATVVGQAVEL